MNVGDIGTIITFEPPPDFSLAGATDVYVLYKKPDGTTGQWAAGVDDGDVVYTVADGDIDQEGIWQLQAKLTIGSWTGTSSAVSVRVGPLLYES